MTMQEQVPDDGMDDGMDDALALVGRRRTDSAPKAPPGAAAPGNAAVEPAEPGDSVPPAPQAPPPGAPDDAVGPADSVAPAPQAPGKAVGLAEAGDSAALVSPAPSGAPTPGTADEPLGPADPAPTDTPAAPGDPATLSPHPERHQATPWPEARAVAARAGAEAARAARRAASVPLERALGRVLAEPLRALTDLPSFDTSAMDGWAVAGPGPWWIDAEGAVLAGHAGAAELADGDAVRIATGARVPAGATAVVRSEHARAGTDGRLHALRTVTHGQDIRPRGQECRTGDRLLPAGGTVTPAVLGLAAAAGYDELIVHPRPRVEVLVLGDELLTAGLPHEGLIRDALGPLLGPWLGGLGAEVLGTRRIGDDAEALYAAVTGSAADVVVTTGGTAAGPVDHVHPVLAKAGATLLVDGVKVRPGHPMLLAALPGARHLVGLPGNPLAAVSGLLTLAEPLLRALAGRPAPAPYRVEVREEIQGHPYDTRLVPVVRDGGEAVPLRYHGPAMLRGIAAADGMAVVPPGGADAGQTLQVLDLPWPAGPLGTADEGACFT
ncbi:molybdopterin molybdenumtransferase MoeA [Streptomyces sp. SKN60]|uniref:molybdopterin molybdotransferase MoeA n=1 Tax=Streptomyces sp. SKN60 TaxID=2855506 RepID=UPI0022482FF4|nr:molybdopterin molybdotransferase MoeA [Streptomyces sp. SKN60]MCX2179226.1 molybdopterin molybdenumtransferase MoeA [Streptomyces sp. SKN60]